MTPPPWYKQFWPWMLILLPGSVVVAAIITLFIAIEHDDSMVLDDYYKQGLAINRELALDQTALDWAMSARIEYLPDQQLLNIDVDNLPGPLPRLSLQLVHPTDARQDQQLVLIADGPGRFTGRSARALAGRWYVQINDGADSPPQWRLRGILQIDATTLAATLTAG